MTAIVSDMGSAKNTAVALFSIKIGNIYISGINNIIFLSKARNMDILALPMEMKVC